MSTVTTVLLATDADWIYDDVDAAISSTDVTLYRVRTGVEVLAAVRELTPDLVILDLQIGNMGGMAACMAIRNEEGADRLPITAVMILLDRKADIFLARRADADGWLLKPLDTLRIRKAARTLLDGYSYYEGIEAEADQPDTSKKVATT